MISPDRIEFFPYAILSEIAFINEVLPAPEAPMMYSVVPGKAYPEQFLRTSTVLNFDAPSFCSNFVDLTIT